MFPSPFSDPPVEVEKGGPGESPALEGDFLFKLSSPILDLPGVVQRVPGGAPDEGTGGLEQVPDDFLQRAADAAGSMFIG